MSPPVPLKNDARATSGKSRLAMAVAKLVKQNQFESELHTTREF